MSSQRTSSATVGKGTTGTYTHCAVRLAGSPLPLISLIRASASLFQAYCPLLTSGSSACWNSGGTLGAIHSGTPTGTGVAVGGSGVAVAGGRVEVGIWVGGSVGVG